MCATHAPDGERGPNAFMANLRQPGPLSWKLQRLIANMGFKVSHAQRCCGKAGEPGC